MKTMFGSVVLSTGIFALIAMPVQADHHMEMQFAPSEMMTCSYNEGKDRDDLKKLTNAFTKWVKKNDADYTYYLLTPNWHEDASEWDFAWIGSWTSGAGMGKGYDAWMEDDDGVGSMFQDVMDCNYSLSSVTPITVPDGGAPWEKGVVWFSRCEIDEDAGLGDAIGAHRAMSSAMAEMGQTSVSWAFLPALGFGDVEFDYYHVQAWPSYSQLGMGFDNYFNKGGWKVQSEAQEDTMSCASPNVYTFRMVHGAS